MNPTENVTFWPRVGCAAFVLSALVVGVIVFLVVLYA